MQEAAADRVQADAHDGAAELVRDTAGMVSPPEVCARAFQLIESQTTNAADIADVVADDPNLTARLLKLVNSPLFGYRSRIDTVARAVAIVGRRELYSLIVAVAALRSFRGIASDLVNMDVFWRHSVFCGLAARSLARACNVLHPERLFVAGLLHDIGALLMFHQRAERCRPLLEKASCSGQSLHVLELEEFGFSHAHVGGLLLEQWRLPDTLHGAVHWHHEPESAGGAQLDASLIHIADALSTGSELGSLVYVPDAEPPLSEMVWQVTGLDPESTALETAVFDAEEELVDTTLGLMGPW